MPRKRTASAPRFIDLFAGIGGMRKAFEAVGGECVFTSEWDRFARITYAANFSIEENELAGDITKIAAKDVPAHDILLAGFPCQPFSLAGVSKKNALGRQHGFLDETQGTLFFDIKRILQLHKPEAFFLENVKNLVSHDGGETFRIIMRVLEEELGYKVSVGVIDGCHWVPQHRERTFIVGFKSRSHMDFTTIAKPSNKAPTLASILHSPSSLGIREIPEAPYTRSGRSIAAEKYTLSDHLWDYLQRYAEKHRLAGNGFGCSVFGPTNRARTLSARYHKDGSEILIRQSGSKAPRRLTPRECARLMGFDNRECEPGKRYIIPVSDTQAYRQFGNSIVVPAATAVAVAMMNHLNRTAKPALSHVPFTVPAAHRRELAVFV